MADSFDLLLSAMRDEVAALDGGEASAIEAATRAKSAALEHVRHTGHVTLDRLAEARALNSLASSRTNMMLAAIDRRIAALAAASGRAGAICYGRDGRAAVSR